VWDPSAPLAVDAVAYQTLVESGTPIGAEFTADMRVLRRGQS